MGKMLDETNVTSAGETKPEDASVLPLMVMLPFCVADMGLALGLLEWIDKLGGAREHDCVLVRDRAVAESAAQAVKSVARRVFKTCGMVATAKSLPREHWPIGPNWMFEHALKANKVYKRPFLWLEPDAVPMRPGWLRTLEDGYVRARKAYLGQVISTANPKLPAKMLSGVAIYPHDAYARLISRVVTEREKNAFDVATADLAVPNTHASRLIWNFHGEKDLPPTFVERRVETSPRNALELSNVPKGAVLFHRSKDGSLVGLLRKKLGL